MVKLGVLGGPRGRVYAEAARPFSGRVRVHAVCDLDEGELAAWRQSAPSVRTYGRLDDLLADPEVTAVYVATPAPDHARHALACLAAGKDVLCEVPAVLTLDDAHALVEAVERSGRVYMLAENYCYIPELRAVRRLCQAGRFGDITYAEGQYVHEARALFWNADGSLTWRGALRRDFAGHSYPTHSLGPIAQWLDLGTKGRDQLATVTAYRTPDASLVRYARERWGERHPSAAPGFFDHGDRVIVVLTTRRHTLVVLQLDTHSPRPPQKAGFTLQGTRGAYVSGRYRGEAGLVWLDNGGEMADSTAPSGWVAIETYGPELFSDEMPVGEGGRPVESRLLADFLAAAEGRRAPAIDVYDAVTWSAVAPLSRQSIAAESRSIDVPAFRPGPVT